jgi:hypothetical protein
MAIRTTKPGPPAEFDFASLNHRAHKLIERYINQTGRGPDIESACFELHPEPYVAAMKWLHARATYRGPEAMRPLQDDFELHGIIVRRSTLVARDELRFLPYVVTTKWTEA